MQTKEQLQKAFDDGDISKKEFAKQMAILNSQAGRVTTVNASMFGEKFPTFEDSTFVKGNEEWSPSSSSVIGVFPVKKEDSEFKGSHLTSVKIDGVGARTFFVAQLRQSLPASITDEQAVELFNGIFTTAKVSGKKVMAFAK